MKLYTSYFSKQKQSLNEHQCISIANSQPGGYITWKDVVPPWWMVDAYKKDMLGWEQFKQLYRRRLDSLNKNQTLVYLSKFDSAVLLCWEKEREHCHRSILAEWLEETFKIEVKELE